MRKASAALVAAAALLGAAACSSTPVYSHDQACSLDAEVVSKLLGSDRFTADEEKLTDVPLTASVPGRTSCLADRDDNRLIVEARIVPDATAASERATAKEASTSFEYRGGVGYTREKAVNWSCGNVSARISVREAPDDQPDWQQLAEPVLDQIGCLTYTAPDVASQPEGWS
jgi:hypothetical protein